MEKISLNGVIFLKKIYIGTLCVLCAAIGFGIGKGYETDRDIVVKTSEFKQKITPSTKMVYEYYYPEDGVTETFEDVPPYFLIDYTFDDVKRCYSNWDIASFSGKEVVMKKTVEGPSSQRYVISENDGFVAVFYDLEDERFLKEVTDVPVSVLNDDIKAEVEEGIEVIGNEKLNRVLEDFTS